MPAVATKRKRLDRAGNYFNEPRRGVMQVGHGYTGVFFHMAGKQFVLLIEQKTQEELGVYVIRNGYWEPV